VTWRACHPTPPRHPDVPLDLTRLEDVRIDATEVAQASLVAMAAGSDFIKTSTDKDTVNATLLAGFVMVRQIREYAAATGHRVGLKPAGGLRTADDALGWLALVRGEL